MRRAAVIGGFGNAGKRHWQAWCEAGWDTAGVADGMDWRKAVEENDAVSICTPDDLHCEMTCFALEQGKHVLCEKPLTHRMDELERIESAVRAADGQTFGTNFPLRHVVVGQSEALPTFFVDAGYEHGRREAYMKGWRGCMPGYSLLCSGGIHLADLIIRHNPVQLTAFPTHAAGWGGCPMYQCGHFDMRRTDQSGTLVRITCQFGYEGRHRVWLTAWDEHGPHEVLDQTDEPYDKLADIRQFIADVEAGNPGNGADAIRANRLCIEMSRGA